MRIVFYLPCGDIHESMLISYMQTALSQNPPPDTVNSGHMHVCAVGVIITRGVRDRDVAVLGVLRRNNLGLVLVMLPCGGTTACRYGTVEDSTPQPIGLTLDLPVCLHW